MKRLSQRPLQSKVLVVTWIVLFALCFLLIIFSPPIASGRKSSESDGFVIEPLVSDGQFVWGPNVGQFVVHDYLDSNQSPLLSFSNQIEEWTAYASINPQIVLSVLEVQHGWVTSIPEDIDEFTVSQEIESTTMGLAVAFYDHLYTWGTRRSQGAPAGILPSLSFKEGPEIQLGDQGTSGSFAVASILAEGMNFEQWQDAISPQVETGFSATLKALFPNVDPLDTSNIINPEDLPPNDFFQLPFPLAAEWTFNGPHSWCGGDHCPGEPPDRSSIDFATNWAKDPPLPDHFTVAAREGTGFIFTPTQSPLPCWIEIEHEIDPETIWTTSYYHLLKLGDPGSVGWIGRNDSLGVIGQEICNGGFANGAHVHFTLKYNGSFVDLDGVKLSGWSVHSGPEPYTTGYLERDGTILDPYERLTNDYHEYYGHGLDYALKFYGSTQPDIDELKIRIDHPENSAPGPPADVGFHDFVIEWWMKADLAANTAPGITCGPNDEWKLGNVLFDRSVSTGGSEWGVSIAGGKIAVGVRGDGTGEITLCSSTSIDDGKWHHIAIQRNRWDGVYPDGQLWLFVDGVLEASELGPDGDLSYPDDALPGNNCGPSGTDPCTDYDPYLFIGSSKWESGLGFAGIMDDLRISWWMRYFDDFTPSPDIHPAEALTAGILRFNEGQGDLVFDTGGFDGGTSNAIRIYGGDPAGPKWVISNLFIKNPVYVPFIISPAP
ncbi:MAG: hypothetical protein GTO18_17260 [Anaerolineales bacterium]|nr:hypothetical protein [Anaerolineales bacterium]